MSSKFGEYFAVAEYPPPDDLLDDEDLIAFRSALPQDERTRPFDELYAADVFTGYRAVMLKKLEVNDVSAVQSAVVLFNHVVESALEGVDSRNPRSYIHLQTPAEFAPSFVDRLIAAVETRATNRDLYETFLGELFESLKPLLEGFGRVFQRGGWPRDDLALGRFLLIVDQFNAVIRRGWGHCG